MYGIRLGDDESVWGRWLDLHRAVSLDIGKGVVDMCQFVGREVLGFELSPVDSLSIVSLFRQGSGWMCDGPS